MIIFDVALERFRDMNYELGLLAKGIEWEAGENLMEGWYDGKQPI